MFSSKDSLEKKPNQNIFEIKDIKQILNHISYNTWLGLDLDNTSMESTQELGSDQWFVNTINYASSIMTDKDEACRLVINLYHAVQHHVQMQAVEKVIIKLIQTLQIINIPILPITARGERIIEPTVRQLNAIGINFNQPSDFWDATRIEFDVGTEHLAVFSHGILFCNGNDKGICLKAFFNYLHKYPEKFLMVDDKAKPLLAVKAAVEECGGTFTGLRYAFLDEKVSAFDFKKSFKQLEEISHKLSLDAQFALKKLKI